MQCEEKRLFWPNCSNKDCFLWIEDSRGVHQKKSVALNKRLLLHLMFLVLLNGILCVQGPSDSGGEQVRPGGTQQHGHHTAHHESAQRDRDLRRGERRICLPLPLSPHTEALERLIHYSTFK